MEVFERIAPNADAGPGTLPGLEQLVFCHDAGTGLRAVIAVHSTRLGPALGGTRFHPYAREDDAVDDVVRLAGQMTRKSAAAGLPLGGGKAVILGDPLRDRTDDLMTAYGRFVDGLGGRYVTAEDVGTTQADMDLIRGVTAHVTGVSESLGGSGDPSSATAFGVLRAMEAVAERLWGHSDLAGRHVVVSGVGKVGADLARRLAAEGARVGVADTRPARVAEVAAVVGAEVVDPATAHTVACDIYAPCAMGGVLAPATIAELGCAAVVGSANNQLADDSCASRLAAAGILYAPDYIVNAGGVVNIAHELAGYDRAAATADVARIRDTTAGVLAEAEAEGILPLEAADRLVWARLSAPPAVTVGPHGGRR